MKFILDLTDKGIYTIIIPPYVLLWGAAILTCLIIAKWHFQLKHRQIQSKEMEKINHDYREGEDPFEKRGKTTNERRAYH